jgi:hypothetical protein
MEASKAEHTCGYEGTHHRVLRSNMPLATGGLRGRMSFLYIVIARARPSIY